MARVTCSVEETDVENDAGREIEGIIATCSKCGHTTESFGVSEESILRCLAVMREECPLDQNNFYVADSSS